MHSPEVLKKLSEKEKFCVGKAFYKYAILESHFYALMSGIKSKDLSYQKIHVWNQGVEPYVKAACDLGCEEAEDEYISYRQVNISIDLPQKDPNIFSILLRS